MSSAGGRAAAGSGAVLSARLADGADAPTGAPAFPFLSSLDARYSGQATTFQNHRPSTRTQHGPTP